MISDIKRGLKEAEEEKVYSIEEAKRMIFGKQYCSCCDIDLDGWIYYEKGKIKLCHFCYNGLEIRNNDKENEDELA